MSFIFKNGPTPSSISFIFGLFKTNKTILTTNQCEKMSCPSSLWRWDLNPQPSEREFPPITTRPGLPPHKGPLLPYRVLLSLCIAFIHIHLSYGQTRIVGKGGLHPRMSLIYKYETLCGFIKGVSGGCFVLLNKSCYPQSGSDISYLHRWPLGVSWVNSNNFIIKAQWIRLHLPSRGPGFESEELHLCFFHKWL